MNFFYLLVASLATFRLALLISHEHGPMRIFDKLRKLPPPKSNAREGLKCHWCVSVHIAAAVSLYLFWLDLLPGVQWPLYWLAISAGSVVMNQLFISKN